MALTNKAATRVKKKRVRLINWEEAHGNFLGDRSVLNLNEG